MNCPACARSLTPLACGDVTMDVCDGGCGGVWFDNFELRKFDEPREHAGELIDGIRRNPDIEIDHTGPRACPKCFDMPMMRHFWSAAHRVEIDDCPACGGIWLDGGELETIRSLFPNESDQRAATVAFIHEAFGDDLAEIAGHGQSSTDLAGRVGRVLSFVLRRPAA